MPQFGLGARADALNKLVLVFLISLLSFSIGTLVGKRFSDSQHKISMLESDSPVVAEHKDNYKIPELEVTEEELALVAEEFATGGLPPMRGLASTSDPQGSDSHGVVTHGSNDHSSGSHGSDNHASSDTHLAPPSHGAHDSHAASDNHSKSDSHDTYASPYKPKDAAPPPKPKKLSLKDTAPGKYTLQLASYPTLASANAKVEELKRKDLTAFTHPAEVKGKTWYRVHVGLFATHGEAKRYRKHVIERTSNTAVIIQKVHR